jgi:fibro-slime domain-containing protein
MAARYRFLVILGLSVAAMSIMGCSKSEVSAVQGGNVSGGNAKPGIHGSGGSGLIVMGTGGTTGGTSNPCRSDNPPPQCQMVPSGPACGDGLINQDWEECDDGNGVPGDGCSGICKVEAHFTCPTPGKPCVSTFRCGDGTIDPGEVCDDGNTTPDDGCSADCTVQSTSFICPTPGQPCTRVEFCGNGRVKGDENCDDGNTNAGDGCDANCHKEPGWLCPVPGSPCQRVKVCGDGIQSPDLGEQCDDGNTNDGDGCSADCKAIESGFQCPTPGKPCVNMTKCGDGIVSGTETCDDANNEPNDGCDNCKIQKGYDCPFPGAKCIAKCGDGILLLNERCDDGNTDNGDGCSSTCQWEKGWACTGSPPNYACHKTTCGDKVKEGMESCDDGNNDLGDGCTPLCTLEPDCGGGACKSTCGDGIVLGNLGEDCDDGNAISGDGCSSTCKVEQGYECKQPALGDTMLVPVVYRDFRYSTQAKPDDFQVGVPGSYAPITGMVNATLDANGKPAYSGMGGQAHVASATSFSQWYKDVSEVNHATPTTMTLWNNGKGDYVNRYGPNGEQWNTTGKAYYCGNVGREKTDPAGNPIPCTSIDPNPTECDTRTAAGQTLLSCTATNGSYSAIFIVSKADGNPLFFPVDDDLFTPLTERNFATIPPYYDSMATWPHDVDANGKDRLHNFSFTSEVRYWFLYDKAKSYTLDFVGDDDVWVFINRKLAVDLGGIHTPVDGSITIGATGNGATTVTPTYPISPPPAATQSTANLGLVSGQVYEIAVFQAERQTDGSSYKLTLSGFNASASVCGPICGDGILSPGEQCDDGTNAGGYGKCEPGCVRGAYCGDGVVNGPEACDNGRNVSAYGTDGCAPGCVTPPRCGDGKVQSAFGENCDDGVNDGTYGGCSSTCQYAARCGDGTVNGPPGAEECDDGANDGSYNNCAPGCKLGPRCGDGVVSDEFGEECDGDSVDGKKCSPNCRWAGVCGDAIVGPDEECDDGINDGGYGECGPGCKLGPRCGDGVTQQPPEECDDGPNPTGGYGQCSKGCVLGPHCGDGKVQPAYEECDDGNKVAGDGCSPACKNEVFAIP